MFERFTRDARDAVTRAQQEAESLGADRIGSVHVLLGAVAVPGPASEALRRCGIEIEDLRRLARAQAPGEIDAAALSSIGVDLAAVRDQVETAFGPGALDRARPTRRRRAFAPDAKKVLEMALREAIPLHHRRIDTGHLLLGAVRLTDSSAHGALAAGGLDDQTVRDAVASVWSAAA
jgi:ATP-dependent Clp protease ATP-binding subunit ClpA